MNDQPNTTSEIDDTEGHSYPVGIQIANSENDTEGHAFRPGGIKPADDGGDDTEGHGVHSGHLDGGDDTEGNCYKYRDAQPQGRPDDTQGHSAKAGHLDAGDDTEGHGQHNPG